LNGGHGIAARAYDAAGNSGTSALISVTVNNADLIPPTTSITFPTTAVSVSSTISISAAASDNVGVTKVEFLMDNVITATSTSSPYVQALNTTTLANSSHSLASRAYDAAGNIGSSVPVTIYVNNLPKDTAVPTVTIASTTDGKGNVYMSATATDNVGIKRVEFYVDGKLNATDTTGPFTTSSKLTGSPGSKHTAMAKAYDAAGNVGTSSVITITKVR